MAAAVGRKDDTMTRFRIWKDENSGEYFSQEEETRWVVVLHNVSTHKKRTIYRGTMDIVTDMEQYGLVLCGEPNS